MSLAWYMRVSFGGIWEFHFGTLAFALYFNFGISISIKYRLISNHLFQTTQEHGSWKQP